ncbi:type II toxin-antitoxin system VapC family toxin [Nocardioides sambongensis]|uniref:type II toxin-antitoxin system VapC family toxin n=1 Tax=Nocardioides sambongensis TaxID=2589074 RepID=UPI00112EC4F3|nr:type II toxin-antitoxin system VapC family toxin [Nocardioides sambongensis]
MIVADTSPLVAIVLGESDAERHLTELVRERCLISAASVVEATIVVEARQGPDATRDLEHLIGSVADRIVPVDADHAAVAVGAWRRFGKGRHPAGLNYGDCFSYATARIAGLPLLFKGDDFGQTDIASAL